MSDHNDHLIAQFCSITGCSNSEEASHFLIASNNEIGTAISLYMDSSNPSNHHHEQVEIENKEPIPPQREILLPSPQSLFQGRLRGGTSLTITNNLPSIFNPPTDIIWKGTFEDAKREGNLIFKYILLTFHRPSEFSCQRTIRDIWRDSLIKEFIKDNLLFYFINEDEGDSSNYLQFYGIESFPHWSLIDPRTGRRVRQWNGRSTITSSEVLQEIAEYIFENPLIIEEEELIIKEKMIYPSLEPEGLQDTISIGFRLPQGKRINRKFREHHNIAHLFSFVNDNVVNNDDDDNNNNLFDLRGRLCSSYREKMEEKIGDNMEDLRNSLLSVFFI